MRILLIIRPDSSGSVSYRTGFAWAADGEITDEKSWLDYLESKTPRTVSGLPDAWWNLPSRLRRVWKQLNAISRAV